MELFVTPRRHSEIIGPLLPAARRKPPFRSEGRARCVPYPMWVLRIGGVTVSRSLGTGFSARLKSRLHAEACATVGLEPTRGLVRSAGEQCRRYGSGAEGKSAAGMRRLCEKRLDDVCFELRG